MGSCGVDKIWYVRSGWFESILGIFWARWFCREVCSFWLGVGLVVFGVAVGFMLGYFVRVLI